MLKFGIIGVGRMGLRHAINLKLGFLKGVKLVAVCDIDQKALDRCRKIMPKVERYSDYTQMIDSKKLDGVIIATPHYSHPEIAEYCINHNVNTLIEKPLAVTVIQAQKVVEAKRNNPEVNVAVSYNQRSNRMYKKAKKIISDERLGKIVRANFIITDWYRSQAYYDMGGWRASYNGEGGGCLINQCVHQLDILQWLIGLPKKVNAFCKTVDRNITVENDVAAILDYSDFICMFNASTHEIKGVDRLEIVFDKGRMVIGKFILKIYIHKSENQLNAETTKGYGFALSRLKVCSYGFFKFLSDMVIGQQLRSLRAFRNQINKKGAALAQVEEGVNAVQLINAIYLSSWTKETVELPVDGEKYENMIALKRKEEQNGH